MAVNPVVYQQPLVAQPLRGWSTGLFGCCQDMNSCCYGYWCCPCLACSTMGEFGESTCLPLVDLLGPGLMAAFGVPTCIPPAGLSLRVAMRHKYHLQGSMCEDITTSCFCIWCSWCQMAREIKNIKTGQTTITAQPIVYSFQPQPQATNTTTTSTSQVFMKNESLSPTMPGQAYPPGPSLMPGQAYPPGPSPMSGQAYPPGPSLMPGQAYPPGPSLMPGQAYPPGPSHMPGQSYPPGPSPVAGQAYPPGPSYMPGKS